MMTAEEARKKAEQNRKTQAEIQSKTVQEKIDRAVLAGQFSITVYNISDAVQDLLKEKGYKIKENSYYDPREGTDYTYLISW